MKYIPKLQNFDNEICIELLELKPYFYNEFHNIMKINEFHTELHIELHITLNSKLRG